MSVNKLKMLGDGPYPLPKNQFFEIINTSVNQDLCIITPKTSIDFLNKDSHAHDSYEFIIPYSTMPYVGVENRCFAINKGNIFPINSWQAHGPQDRMLNMNIISLQVDNDSLGEIAYSIYGKFNICFKQGNNTLSNDLKALVELFIEEYRSIQPGRNLILKSLSTQILASLIEQIENNMPSPVSSSYSTAKKNLDKAIEYLRDQYDEDYSLEEAAQVARLSCFHFIRVFKSYTGKTPYEYLMLFKLNKAKELLISNRSSITEICFMCGFNSLSNFTNFFKKRVGVTPSEYRKIMAIK